MRQLFFKICCLCMLCHLQAQTTDVVDTGLIGSIYLAHSGDYLFISEFQGDRISKINISDGSPLNLTTVISGLNGPQGLLMVDNILYIAESEGGAISKIDITQLSPTKTTILSGLSYPTGMAIKNNELYIAELNANRVSKIDLSLNTPVRQDVVINLNGPTGLCFNNDDLYIVEQPGARVSKIDINTSIPTTMTQTVVTGLSGSYQLTLDGNDLYIAEYLGNKITKIDITAPIPTTTTLVESNVNGPAGTYIVDDELFITELNASKLTKVALQTLGTQLLEQQGTIFVYPNPTRDRLYIDTKQAHNAYEIYNILGVRVKVGTIPEHAEILVSDLTKGLYMLYLKHTDQVVKFIKY